MLRDTVIPETPPPSYYSCFEAEMAEWRPFCKQTEFRRLRSKSDVTNNNEEESELLNSNVRLMEQESSNVLDYFNDIPKEIRGNLAKFFSTGDPNAIEFTKENFHHFFHAANILNYHKLTIACVQFYLDSNRQEIRHSFGDCECIETLDSEVRKCFHRSNSVPWDARDQDDTQKYAVLFLTRKEGDVSQEVVIMDTATNFKVYKQRCEKIHRFGLGFACCSMNISSAPYVFISGGIGKSYGAIMKYDVIEDKWTKCQKMQHGRSHHMMAAVDDCIYLIGGDGTPCIEEFHPRSNKCSEIGSLLVPVHSAPYVVFKDKIYIFGGKTQTGDVSTVQCIDTKHKTIEHVGDLPCACSGGQAVIFEDQVYIAPSQGNMIWYDPSTHSSQLCAHQPYIRKDFIMFVRNSRIFMAGGVSEETSDNCLCKYCPDQDRWKQVAKLSKNLSVYTSCIVRFPQRCPIVPFDSRR